MKPKITLFAIIALSLNLGVALAEEQNVLEIPLTSENSSFAIVSGDREPDVNKGKSEHGIIFRTHWDGRGIYSLLRVDELPKIKADNVKQAVLKIHVKYTRQWGTSETMAFVVKLIPSASADSANAWDQDGVTFATAGTELQRLLNADNHEGSVSEGEIGPLDNDQGIGWYSVDITDYLKEWLRDPKSNNGVVITPLDTAHLGYGMAAFQSPYSDFQSDEFIPRISITLTK